MSFHCFPEDLDDHDNGLSTTTELYPDLAQRDEARKVPRVVKRAMGIAGSCMALLLSIEDGPTGKSVMPRCSS
jgi:hypothetical protein